jgi:dienelactone hydrolase
MRRFCLLLALIIAFGCAAAAQSGETGLAGAWEGAISVMGQELKIIVHFDERPGSLAGTIDIPQQMAMGLPLANLRREGERLHFELNAGPGVAAFDGVLTREVIQGDFMQAGIKGTFSLARGEAKAGETAAEKERAEPLPYKAEEVAIANGDITLHGTLTLPEGPGPFPAVIMITGSGTQNRDEEIFGFRPFRIIADHLTRRGIAVLRCDDRGLGGKEKAALATSLDFATDVVAQAGFLEGRKEIMKNAIGLIGHSEGGIIAPLAGRSHNFAFMVLIAGTAVKGEDVILEQAALIARADGAGEKEVAKAAAEQKRVYQLLDSPSAAKEIEKIIEKEVRASLDKMSPEKRKAVSDPEAYVRTLTASEMNAVTSPWFRYFLSYDPAPVLEQLKCPVLALFGGKDLQVSVKQNLPVMEQAFKKGHNAQVAFKVFPEANHLFLKAKTGSPSEYASLEKTFVPGFLDTISSWILKVTGAAKQGPVIEK